MRISENLCNFVGEGNLLWCFFSFF